ncbi:MAG: HupE/UreJ family protein [Myxococcales bacterium]|nr:HupE/UreJ family protein [Myxococcales bacterium]
MLLGLAAPAAAHDVGLARVAVEVGEAPTLAVVLDGRIADVAQLLDLPEGVPIPPRVFDQALPGAIDGWIGLRADGAPCALVLDRWRRLDALALRLELTATCPAPPVDLTIDWPAAGDPRLRWSALVGVTGPEGAQAPEVLGRDQPAVTLRVGQAPPASATLWRFGALGVEHILLGWDHLAFVLALMLGCSRLRRLLAVVTGFTVAHSVTLGLGATGLVELPPLLVEPVIALSIAAAAGVGLWRLRRGRLDHPGRAEPQPGGVAALLALCFGFGLIHGFGFAGLLAELLPPGGARLWPLLGFNVGVELGQIACVALAWPLLVWVGRGQAARPVFAALLVGLVALGLVITALRLL